MIFGVSCFWRFKGMKEWRYGFPSRVDGDGSLVRMGTYNGMYHHGPIVSKRDIEVRQEGRMVNP
jgi:hypothetical protein